MSFNVIFQISSLVILERQKTQTSVQSRLYTSCVCYISDILSGDIRETEDPDVRTIETIYTSCVCYISDILSGDIREREDPDVRTIKTLYKLRLLYFRYPLW